MTLRNFTPLNNVRLAVLVSGSFRNFNEVWPANMKALDKLQLEYEVFFHTWTDNPSPEIDVLDSIFYNRLYLSIFNKEFKPFIPTISKQQILNDFNFRDVKVRDFDEKSIATEFNLGTPETNPLFRPQLNSCGMYLGIDSIYQSVNLSNSFTHFLRLRPDFLLDANSLGKIFTNDLVFFGQLLPTPEGPIGDQCYGGLLSKSEFILNTLAQLKVITGAETWNKPQPAVLAENVIRQHLAPHRNSLKICYLSGHGAIARPRLKLADHALSLKGLIRILLHNFTVVRNKAKRLVR